MGNKLELVIINAASKTLELYSKFSQFSNEEIIKKVISQLDLSKLSKDSKLVAIPTISLALKLKKLNKNLTDKQIIQKVLGEKNNLILNTL